MTVRRVSFALLAACLPAVCHAQVVTIDGTDAIFLAGRTDLTIPAPNVAWPGGLARGGAVESLQETLPPIFSIVPGSTVRVAAPATGLVSFAQGFGIGQLDPDGDLFGGIADIDSFGGISGYFGSSASLVGVFLTDDVPNGAAPAEIDFQAVGTEFMTLSPGLNQVFHIGDGLNDGGTLQSFVAPAGATRFAIGIADANSGRGAPGFYTDNDGFFEITLDMDLIPTPGTGALLGIAGLACSRRRR